MTTIGRVMQSRRPFADRRKSRSSMNLTTTADPVWFAMMTSRSDAWPHVIGRSREVADWLGRPFGGATLCILFTHC